MFLLKKPLTRKKLNSDQALKFVNVMKVFAAHQLATHHRRLAARAHKKISKRRKDKNVYFKKKRLRRLRFLKRRYLRKYGKQKVKLFRTKFKKFWKGLKYLKVQFGFDNPKSLSADRPPKTTSYQFMFDGNKHRIAANTIPHLVNNARSVLQKKNTLADLASQGRSEYYKGALRLSANKRFIRKAVGTNWNRLVVSFFGKVRGVGPKVNGLAVLDESVSGIPTFFGKDTSSLWEDDKFFHWAPTIALPIQNASMQSGTGPDIILVKKSKLKKSLFARENNLIARISLNLVEEWSVLFTNSVLKVRKSSLKIRRRRFRNRFRRRKRRARKRRVRKAYNFARAKWSFATRQRTGRARKLNRKKAFLRKTLTYQKATTSSNFKKVLLFNKRVLRFRRKRNRKRINKIKKVKFVRPRRRFRRFVMSRRQKRVRGVRFVYKQRRVRVLRNRFWKFRYNFRRKLKGSYTVQAKYLFKGLIRQKTHPVLRFVRMQRFLKSSVPFFSFPRRRFRRKRRWLRRVMIKDSKFVVRRINPRKPKRRFKRRRFRRGKPKPPVIKVKLSRKAKQRRLRKKARRSKIRRRAKTKALRKKRRSLRVRLKIFRRRRVNFRRTRIAKQKKLIYLNKLGVSDKVTGAGFGTRKQLRLLHTYFVKNRTNQVLLLKRQLAHFKGQSLKHKSLGVRIPNLTRPSALQNVFGKYGISFKDSSTLKVLKKKHMVTAGDTFLGRFAREKAVQTPLTNATLFGKSITALRRTNTALLAGSVFRLGAKQRTLVSSNIVGIEKLQHVYRRRSSKRQKSKIMRKYRRFYTKLNKFGKVKLMNKSKPKRKKAFLATALTKSYYINRKAAIFRRRIRKRRKRGKRKYSRIKHKKRMRRRRLRKGRLIRKYSRKRRSYLLGRVRAQSIAWVFTVWKRRIRKVRRKRMGTKRRSITILKHLTYARKLSKSFTKLSKLNFAQPTKSNFISNCREISKLVSRGNSYVDKFAHMKSFRSGLKDWLSFKRYTRYLRNYVRARKITKTIRQVTLATKVRKFRRFKKLRFFFKKKYKIAVLPPRRMENSTWFSSIKVLNNKLNTFSTLGHLRHFKAKKRKKELRKKKKPTLASGTVNFPQVWYSNQSLKTSLLFAGVKSNLFVGTFKANLSSKTDRDITFYNPKTSIAKKAIYLRKKQKLSSLKKPKSLRFKNTRPRLKDYSLNVRKNPHSAYFFNKLRALTKVSPYVVDKRQAVQNKDYSKHGDFILNNVKLAKKRLMLRMCTNFKVGTEYTQVMHKIRYAFRKIPRRMRRFIKRTNFVLTIFYLITFKEIHVWANFLQNLFYRYTYKKHRVVFYTVRRLLKLIGQNVFQYVTLSGIYFQLKGKVTGKGGTRKKTLRHSSGLFSASTHSHVFKYKFKQVWSKSGATGLKTIIVHSI